MQGVRQADLRVGENVVVIGLDHWSAYLPNS